MFVVKNLVSIDFAIFEILLSEFYFVVFSKSCIFYLTKCDFRGDLVGGLRY